MVHSRPVCHGPGSPLIVAGGFEFAMCRHCSHQFPAIDTDLAHTPSHYADHHFTGGGGGYADYKSERIR